MHERKNADRLVGQDADQVVVTLPLEVNTAHWAGEHMAAQPNWAGLPDDLLQALDLLMVHLHGLDANFQAKDNTRLAQRAREVVLLADYLQVRPMGQVAADVMYCIKNEDDVALSATLSRLLRVIVRVLEDATLQIS